MTRSECPPEGIVRGLDEAYLLMTDRGVQDPPNPQAMTNVLVCLESLCSLMRRGESGHQAAYEVLGELTPGALRLVAAQAIVELDRLDFEAEVEEEAEVES